MYRVVKGVDAGLQPVYFIPSLRNHLWWLPRQMEATTYQRFGLRFGLTYLTGFACHPEPVEGSNRFIRVIGLV